MEFGNNEGERMKVNKPTYYEDVILKVILENPNITNNGLVEKVGISKNVISKKLQLLKSDRLISKCIRAGKKNSFYAREGRNRDCVFTYETYAITLKGRRYVEEVLSQSTHKPK